MDDQSGHLREITEPDGTVRGHVFTDMPARYAMGDGLDEQTATLARAALDAVTLATDGVLRAIDKALEPLSGGRLLSAGNRVSIRWGGRWDEALCSCCASPDQAEEGAASAGG